jgi:hypothetical protein
MPNEKNVPPIMKKSVLRPLIGALAWMILFSGLSTNVVDVSAFSTATQCLQRTKTSPIDNALKLKNRSFQTQTMSRTVQLYERNNDEENDNTNNTDAMPSGTALETSTTSNGATIQIDYSKVKPQVVPQRWVQLAYLSLLALLSDWVCFSVAAAPQTFESNFGHSAASIIDIFLFTNVATSFLVTDIVSKFGLQRAIQGAAIFMTAGCWLRSGFGFVPNAPFIETGNILVDYPWIVAGTVLVGIAQPFFQCTPPLLSAKWFANNERSTSTAIALNFNQIGIATAFLVGGGMATDTVGLENYFGIIAITTTIVTIGTLLQFQNEPPFPPSSSELEKLIRGEEEPPFLESVQTFFSTKGFSPALAAFVCSISITNVVGVSAIHESFNLASLPYDCVTLVQHNFLLCLQLFTTFSEFSFFK